MQKAISKAFFLLFMATTITILGLPAMANSSQITETDACALVQDYFPEGIGFGEATAEQLRSAVYQAVSTQPGAAELMVRCTVQQRPDQAGAIAAAAASVLPDQASVFTNAAIELAPGQADAVWHAVDNAVYAQRQDRAREALEQTARDGQKAGAAPPIRDDAPASPVN